MVAFMRMAADAGQYKRGLVLLEALPEDTKTDILALPEDQKRKKVKSLAQASSGTSWWGQHQARITD